MKHINVIFTIANEEDSKEVLDSLFEWYEENDAVLGDLVILENGAKVSVAGLKEHYRNSLPRTRKMP